MRNKLVNMCKVLSIVPGLCNHLINISVAILLSKVEERASNEKETVSVPLSLVLC